MNFIYSKMRKKGIRFQLLVYFISLILLAVVVLSIVATTLYSNELEKEVAVYKKQVIGQIKTNIDSYVKNMEEVTYYLSKNSDVTDFLKCDGKNEAKLETLKDKTKNDLKVYEDAHGEIAGIMIVSEKDYEVSNTMKRISRDSLLQEHWYTECIENPKVLHLFSKPIGRKIAYNVNESADDVVSVAKAIYDDKTNKVLGVILIDMKLDTIKKVIEKGELGSAGFVYIMDATGGIVYTPVNNIVYRIRDSWFNGKDSFVKSINNEDYELLSDVSNYTEWTTVGVFSLKDSDKVITSIRMYTVAIALGVSLLGITAALIFSSTIANPIKKLRKLMKKAEEGDLDVRFETKYDDEIGQLGNSFNNMIEKIKNLLNLVYVEQKRKREAELKILESQINPHFLYNTLDTIQWSAQEHEAQDIVDMVSALTNLFRIGLNKGKEQVKVSEELKHVESYLIIQMTRYEGKFTYEIECEEEILNYHVIKIILQPMVENAIYHGIKARRGTGKIKISAKKREDKILFVVEDDGAGMSKERLNVLNSMLSSGKAGSDYKGYGVFNVNERIRLSYGNDYGVHIESEKDKGTRIEITHPLLMMDNGGN